MNRSLIVALWSASALPLAAQRAEPGAAEHSHESSAAAAATAQAAPAAGMPGMHERMQEMQQLMDQMMQHLSETGADEDRGGRRR
jgi:hypothetical protein